jgi:hypothetical protein
MTIRDNLRVDVIRLEQCQSLGKTLPQADIPGLIGSSMSALAEITGQ